MDEFEDKRVVYAISIAGVSLVSNLVILTVVLLVFNHSGFPNEDTNALAVSVTTIEIFLVIVALGGFWMLRQTVDDRAKRETQAMLKHLGPTLISAAEDEARRTAERTALRVLEGALNQTSVSDQKVAEQTAAMGE